jgi:hypothetical protein
MMLSPMPTMPYSSASATRQHQRRDHASSGGTIMYDAGSR